MKKTPIGTSNLALSFRKHLSNTRLRKIEQREFERIINITLESKTTTFNLNIELFRPGNVILTNNENKIILASTYKGFGSRMIRPNTEYKYPKREFNFLKLKENEFSDLLNNSKKSSIVTALAIDLNLGGKYAEQLCELAKIDKKSEIKKEYTKKLFNAIKKIKPISIEPAIEKESKYDKEKRMLEQRITQQEETIEELKKSIAENTKKAELIYENYSKIKLDSKKRKIELEL